MTWNSRTLREELERMDPKLKPGDDAYAAGLMLLASVVVGPSQRKTEDICLVNRGRFSRYAAAAKANGIWKSGKVCCEWFEPNGGAAFWMDVAVCLGFMERQ